MPIPDYETLMVPLLTLAAENPNKELLVLNAVKSLADKFGLNEEERRELLPSGATFKFSSRVSWAATYLKKAGLLEASSRSHVRITQRGLDVLKKHPLGIDGDFLSQFEEFRQFQNKKKDKKAKNSNNSQNSETPIESIDSQYRKVREALASELLEKVKKCSPQFFERLVITLLVRIGYGGSLKDAGAAIGRSGDGGVDGEIKEDKLGLDKIYVQAKRWADKGVGSPDIDQFVGALSKKKANKGIFLTTSTFSRDALASVEKYGAKLVLLDGPQVAQLMIDYGVGVSIDQIYEIKKMDSDFFEEDEIVESKSPVAVDQALVQPPVSENGSESTGRKRQKKLGKIAFVDAALMSGKYTKPEVAAALSKEFNVPEKTAKNTVSWVASTMKKRTGKELNHLPNAR